MGGTESSNDVFVYALKSNRPALLWKFATGDRAEGGLLKTYAHEGKLVVELAGQDRFVGGKLYGGDCTGTCRPPFFTRATYEWTGGAFRRRGLENLPFTGWSFGRNITNRWTRAAEAIRLRNADFGLQI
jgi:hypothetical protein